MHSNDHSHLLIDGYNVIHACPELRRFFLQSAESARQQLVEQVRVIHDFDVRFVSVVFDGSGPELTFEHPGNQPTFTVIFSSNSLTADDIIEQLVLKSNYPKEFTIISADNMIKSSVRSAGAVVFNPEYLFDWVERCSQRQARVVEQQRKRQSKTWGSTSPWDVLG